MYRLLLVLLLGIGVGYLYARTHSSKPVVPIPESTIAPMATPFFDDRTLQTTQTPQGASFWPGKIQDPHDQPYPSGCLLSCNSCSPICSGEENRCGIVAPVPSAVWQPQSASTVQYRLKSGNYVPSVCPQGPLVLQSAPGCQGAYNSSQQPYMTPCYTAQDLTKMDRP
jgi:hypothetical protein